MKKELLKKSIGEGYTEERNNNKRDEMTALKQSLPVALEEIEKFECEFYRPVVMLKNKKHLSIKTIPFQDIQDVIEFAKVIGFFKWELKGSLSSRPSLHCSRSNKNELEIICHPQLGLTVTMIMAIFLIAGVIIKQNSHGFVQIVYFIGFIYLAYQCTKELYLFGNIAAIGFLSYPQIIISHKVIKYTRRGKTIDIPWDDINSLRHNVLGLTLILKNGTKYTIPDRIQTFYPILINIITKRGRLKEKRNETTWKRWIIGSEWQRGEEGSFLQP